MDISERFVSKDWLAAIPFAGFLLFAGLIGEAPAPFVHPGLLLSLSGIALLGSLYLWTSSRWHSCRSPAC
jgi:hypothetical protein